MRKLDIPSMTATQLTRKYGQGNLSPVEVIEVVFDRIKALNQRFLITLQKKFSCAGRSSIIRDFQTFYFLVTTSIRRILFLPKFI